MRTNFSRISLAVISLFVASAPTCVWARYFVASPLLVLSLSAHTHTHIASNRHHRNRCLVAMSCNNVLRRRIHVQHTRRSNRLNLAFFFVFFGLRHTALPNGETIILLWPGLRYTEPKHVGLNFSLSLCFIFLRSYRRNKARIAEEKKNFICIRMFVHILFWCVVCAFFFIRFVSFRSFVAVFSFCFFFFLLFLLVIHILILRYF